MIRARYQVLVLPYKKQDDKILYCIFKESDKDNWHFVAGIGKDEDASPLVSAKREAYEKAHIPFEAKYEESGTTYGISTEELSNDRFVLEECPIYCFAVEMADTPIEISNQNTIFEWVDFQTAIERLKNDSDRIALREINWDFTGKMF